MDMPIIDLSDGTPRTVGFIDWSKPQPPGVYRCWDGWSSGETEWGCSQRGITEGHDGNLRCHNHALIAELASIHQELSNANELRRTIDEKEDTATEEHLSSQRDAVSAVDGLSEHLWDINRSFKTLAWYAMPRWRRWGTLLMDWWETRRESRGRKGTSLYYQSDEEKAAYETAYTAVQMWLKYSTPSNAGEAAKALTMLDPYGDHEHDWEVCTCGACVLRRLNANYRGTDGDESSGSDD